MLLEVTRERERILAVALRAEQERLETLQEEERGERVECCAQIAQDF
jgi:hypothetical protein